MAKIFFLQNIEFEYFGPMYISSAVKAHGHQCRVLVGSSAKDFRQIIEKERPEVIAFSVMTGSHTWALKIASGLKSLFPFISIFGGPHPTLSPDIINNPQVDIICIGEGENACAELLNRIDNKKPYTDISNLWVKENGAIHRNDVRALDDDLDDLPFPDRELYRHIKNLADEKVRRFLTSRGCPYNCSYCFNHKMKEMYHGKGKWVRKRRIEPIIEELLQVKAGFQVNTVYFCDDTFVLKKSWTLEFLKMYKERVGLPFFCLIRADQLDDEIVSSLKDAGCTCVFFGVESGNEDIRKNTLNKNITNKQIEAAAELLHKYKIKFRTYNMIALPGETLENAFETVKLNIKIKSDFPWCSLYAPYPGTDLASRAVQTGMLKEEFTLDDIGTSFHQSSVLNHPRIGQFINLHKFFQTGVKFPWTLPVIRLLIKLPNNILFNLWFGIIYFWLYIRAEQRSFFKTAIFAIKSSAIFVFWKRSDH
jgi:radical SAM superfamily enzyme YgiQ (UPF0313 family)